MTKEVKDKVVGITIERTTAIEKSRQTKTIKQVVKMKDKLRFDLAIQRNSVWKLEQKSLFIHSLMYGFPFPPAYAQYSTDGQAWMLDGKQRLTTIIDFVEDKFYLHKNTPNVFGFDVAEMKFSELPEQFRDEILDTSFDIWELKNMTEEERDEMFFRLNNGSALSKIEVTRSMYSQLFSEVSELAELEFFANTIHLTESARNRFVDQELVIQIAMLLNEDYKLKGFGGSHIRDYVVNLKESQTKFSDEIIKCFKETSEYLSDAFKDFTNRETVKSLKKLNVPMVFIQGITAKEKGMSAEQFGEFVKWFLIDMYQVDSPYGISCQSGSAKRENVMTRLKEMDKAFSKYVKKNPIEKYVPQVEEEDNKKEETKKESKKETKKEETVTV
jgi:hypothetical protein